MAIINLNTGSIDRQQQGAAPTMQPQGRIIDLDTGGFVDKPVGKPEQMEHEPVQIDPNIMQKGLQIQQQREQSALSQPLSQLPEERGETRAAQELPELGTGGLLSGEDQAKVGALVPVLLATTDPQEMAGIISSNFPNVGIQSDPGGNLIATNNKTGARVILNKPGLSQLDVVQGLGIAAAFTPAARGAGLATSVGGKALAGGAGAGLTQAAIEAIQSQVGGELDESEIAIAATLGGVAEVVVPAIQALREARQASKVGAQRADLQAVKESVIPAQQATAGLKGATGKEVGLFPAQQTQVPSELLKQRVLPQLDASSRQAAQALEKQNKEVFEATSELINTIAPPSAVETGSKRFKTAAQKANDARVQARSAVTKPLYDEALEAGAVVDLTSTKALIDDVLSEAPKGSDFERVGKQLKALIEPLKKGEKPTLRQLQKAKIAMQDIISGAGDKAVSSTLKREIAAVKKDLVEQMRAASPLFAEAEEQFIKLSPAVKELEDSLIGQVSRIDDINLKNIAQRIFDPKTQLTDPTVIKNAKRVIDKVDPGAWNDILRVELNRRVGALEDLVQDVPGELVGNTPGQLRRAIFGNPSQRKALFAGMNEDQKKNFRYLDEVLRRASTGRAAGSPTAAFGQAIEQLRGAAGILRDVIFRPLKTLQETGERSLFDRNVSTLAEAMFNPKFQPQVDKLRRLDPNSPAAARAMAQLLKMDQEQ